MPYSSERYIPEYYGVFGGTNPGVAADIPWNMGTDNGTTLLARRPYWEQVQWLVAQQEWLNFLRDILPDRTGGTGFVPFITVEGCLGYLIYEKETEFPSYETQVAAIRSALSLQMKELAEIIGVERPTLYSWINDQNAPHASNRERLQTIYRLAKDWNNLSSKPLGKALHRVDEKGRSVFDLLRDSSISRSSVLARFRAISQAAQSELAKKPTSVRELARKHGIDLNRVADRQDEIDLETGKQTSGD